MQNLVGKSPRAADVLTAWSSGHASGERRLS
jgi:hypothetical protein